MCDFSLEKANLPQNTIFYLTQGYLSYKDNKRIYYTDIFVIRKLLLYLINQNIWRNMSLLRTRLRYLEQNMMWVLDAFLVLSTVWLIWLFLVITTRFFLITVTVKRTVKFCIVLIKWKFPTPLVPLYLIGTVYNTSLERLVKLNLQIFSFTFLQPLTK